MPTSSTARLDYVFGRSVFLTAAIVDGQSQWRKPAAEDVELARILGETVGWTRTLTNVLLNERRFIFEMDV